MRLTRPTIASPTVVTCDSTDLPGNTLNNELKNDCTALQGMEALAVGQFMVLPQSFGYVSHLQMFFCIVIFNCKSCSNVLYLFSAIYIWEKYFPVIYVYIMAAIK